MSKDTMTVTITKRELDALELTVKAYDHVLWLDAQDDGIEHQPDSVHEACMSFIRRAYEVAG